MSEFNPFDGPLLERAVPTSQPQKEIWTSAGMGEEASAASNESVTLDLKGVLDGAALERALNDLIARHESLRTTFSHDGKLQLIAAPGHVPLPVLDFSALGPAEAEARFQEELAREMAQVFDLEKGPLVRAWLARLSEQHHRFVFSAHHIVCDGTSLRTAMEELGKLYSAYRRGVAPDLPPAPSYSEFALAEQERQTTEEWKEAERYWLELFRNLPEVIELPLDHPRPPVLTHRAGRLDVEVPPELMDGVKASGGRIGCTLFAMAMAAFEVLIHRISGQEDLCIGVPSSGQYFTGNEGLVGHCVNTLPLRLTVRAEAPFSEVARAVRSTLADAWEHQAYTYGALLQKLPLKRDPSRLPLVSLLFNLDQAVGTDVVKFDGLELRYRTNVRLFETAEIFLNACSYGDAFLLECQYKSDLFDEETIRVWMDAYVQILTAIAVDPHILVRDLPLLSKADRERRIEVAKGPALEVDPTTTINSWIERTAARKPEAVAVEDGEGALRYGELLEEARTLARRLRAAGVQRGDRVGLCMERSRRVVVGMLGVLEAGAAYVPLDARFPRERLRFIVEDTGMEAVVVDSAGEEAFADLDVHRLHVDVAGPRESIAVPGELERPQPNDLAYVIYTSGSTGQPKGVLIPHRTVVNLLQGFCELPLLREDDRVLAIGNFTFDISVPDVFLPLVRGARVRVASDDEVADGALLVERLDDPDLRLAMATPSTWRMVRDEGWKGNDRLVAVAAGEALAPELGAWIAERVQVLYNGYGPTEATVYTTFYPVPRGGLPMRIGRPLGNVSTYVLDGQGEPVPVGVPGELWIGGAGVGLGYHERSELTAERFVDDPFVPGGKMYRSGDLVRWCHDGHIEYLGRNDFQVKVRGYRIELNEIESCLLQHPEVARTAVIVREDQPDDQRIVAYVVSRGHFSEVDLRKHARRMLPTYMVPQHFVELDELPLLPSAKLDRKALPPPAGAHESQQQMVAPRTGAEKLLARFWADAIGVEQVGLHDNFFDLGGHSLLCLQVIAQVQRTMGVRLRPRSFITGTLEQIAAEIPGGGEAQMNGEPAASNEAPASTGGGRLRDRLLGAFAPRRREERR